MSEIEVVEKWESVTNQSSMFQDILNSIWWGITWLLKSLCDACEGFLDEVYKLLDFTNYAGLDKFFNSTELRLILGALFAIALMYLGITMIFGKKQNKMLQSIVLFVMVVTSLPTFMTYMNDIVIAGRDFINTDGVNVSDQIIASSVVDLVAIDTQGQENYTVVNGVVTPIDGSTVNLFHGSRAGNINYINPNELLTDKSNLNSDLFLKKINVHFDGTTTADKIETDWWFIFSFTAWNYRYNINYLAIYIGLIAATIALFFTAFKSTRIIFELAFHQLFATLLSASDVTGGQKVIAVLKSIVSSYLTLLTTVVLLKFFILGLEFLSQTISNPLTSSLMLIAFAWAVIDGPNIIEKILGVDAGLSSGFRTMATLFMGAKTFGSVAKGIGKGIGLAVGATGGLTLAGAGAVGSMAGKKEASSNLGSSNSSSNTSNSSPVNNTSSNNNIKQDNPSSNNNSTNNSSSSNTNNGNNNSTIPTDNNSSNLDNASSNTETKTPGTDSSSSLDNANLNNNNVDTATPITDTSSSIDNSNLNNSSIDTSTPINSNSIDSSNNINAGQPSPVSRDTNEPPRPKQNSNSLFSRVQNSYKQGFSKGYHNKKDKIEKGKKNL